jgi:hypothetical protein
LKSVYNYVKGEISHWYIIIIIFIYYGWN